MKSPHVTIRPIGNSHGIVIPKPLLAQVGLVNEAEISAENGALVLRKSSRRVREGWSAAAQTIAERGDDTLVMGEFGNADDDEGLAW